MTHWIIPPGLVCQWDLNNLILFTRVLCAHCRYNNVIMDALVALTNANSQPLQVVPLNNHSALVLSTLALLVTSEGEYSSPITTTGLIRLLRVVPRHQLALWVVPLYWSWQWTCGLYTVHSLISHSDGQRHVRMWVRQASAIILQVSSRR